MEINTSTVIEVQDPSQIAEARRVAVGVGREYGLSADRCNDLAIVVSELATNLLKHGSGGVVTLRRAETGGIEIVALDKGRGFGNVERSMEDGYSTSGTPGNGLGAVSRLASGMEIYSRLEQGSAIFAKFAEPAVPRSPLTGAAWFELGATCIPVHGETACGDAYAIREANGGCAVMVVDGLGHGVFAAEAAAAAVDAFDKYWTRPITEVVSAIHDGMKATRGGAVAVAKIDLGANLVHYCGVGNIAGAVIFTDGIKRMVSHNGIAGQRDPKVAAFTYPWRDDAMLVMHSDGLTGRWDIEAYAGILAKHPAILAGVLYRDHTRGRDDSTVVVVRRGER